MDTASTPTVARAIIQTGVEEDLFRPEVLHLQSGVFAEMDALSDPARGIEHIGARLEEWYGADQIAHAQARNYRLQKSPVTCQPEVLCYDSGLFEVQLTGKSIQVLIEQITKVF